MSEFSYVNEQLWEVLSNMKCLMCRNIYLFIWCFRLPSIIFCLHDSCHHYGERKPGSAHWKPRTIYSTLVVIPRYGRQGSQYELDLNLQQPLHWTSVLTNRVKEAPNQEREHSSRIQGPVDWLTGRLTGVKGSSLTRKESLVQNCMLYFNTVLQRILFFVENKEGQRVKEPMISLIDRWIVCSLEYNQYRLGRSTVFKFLSLCIWLSVYGLEELHLQHLIEGLYLLNITP